ncbi:hypothetical protein [Cupriavidus sp. 2SB]|uniref:hypothetical protein n=1 Tax=Cupriavidus sp. 2SB TaxID=2502199 RepID=UPI0010F96EB9|nr:hypothetical protein [Cupriavidus sp. 2SB]
MIELVVTRCCADSAEMEISCAADRPNDQLLRFIRAKVSVENLLPADAIVSSSRHLDTGIAHLAWKVDWPQLADHLMLVRAAFAVANLNYVYSARRPIDGVGRSKLR